MVPQDTPLFHADILHNVRYGRMDASDEEVKEVCRRAKVSGTIEGLPDGYNTKVGERGLMISGGEKQRSVLSLLFVERDQFIETFELTRRCTRLVWTSSDWQSLVFSSKTPRSSSLTKRYVDLSFSSLPCSSTGDQSPLSGFCRPLILCLTLPIPLSSLLQTSALDSTTEQELMAEINAMLQTKKRTSVFIAHRLRTVSDAGTSHPPP